MTQTTSGDDTGVLTLLVDIEETDELLDLLLDTVGFNE
jgi:hypothetical protein